MWKLPDGFPEIKYSCFNDPLCIFEWKPTREQEAIALCLKVKPEPCFDGHAARPSRALQVRRRGPESHLRADRHQRDPLLGRQLRPASSERRVRCAAISDCSLVPIAVQCPAGEVCKFRSLAAGGDHTCAVDTNGKAWCWGEDGSLATGDSSLGALPKHTHRRIPAFTDLGVPADFVAIDTDFTHTCAVSAAQDVFCWGDNFFGQLGAPQAIPSSTRAQLVRSGNRYKSMRRACRIPARSRPATAWWIAGATTRTFSSPATSIPAKFITINSKVPLANRGVQFMAAGATTTCAQVSNDDTVCWGKPSANSPNNSASQGFVALRASYARSHCHGRHRVQRRLSELLAHLHRRPGRRSLLCVLAGRRHPGSN